MGEVREEYADHSEGRPSADRFSRTGKQAHKSEGWRDYLDFGPDDLEEVEFTGVGEFKCEKPLKLDVIPEIKGVVK